jgi:hypothetical protein
MRITPPTRLSEARDTADGFQVVIPARRYVFLLIFLLVWLSGWAMGEVSVVSQLMKLGKVDWSMVFWLTGWTCGGMFASAAWLWLAFGREVVTLRSGELSVRREALGLGRSKEYDLAYVKNLRVSRVPSASSSPTGRLQFPLKGGLVAFDYGAKTIRFGGSLDEAEAAQVVSDLQQRHAFGPAT